jgi:alpha-N-arabinofuranosidase
VTTTSPITDQTERTGSASQQTATVTIDRRRPISRIDPMIFGHFLESNFFGNIEGGVFDEGSGLALSGDTAESGLRTDVIELCRRLGVPIVRWPGGNFTSAYHWEDGVGPRDARPRRLDLTWGGEETNRFGTDEFLAWCSRIDAKPYLVHSCRSVDDAVRWVEYTNYGGDTAYTRTRAANGHPDPYRVRYWGVGNEVYGPWQMGHRSAEQYAADARDHGRFMKQVDSELSLIGVGLSREEWMRPVLNGTRDLFDYVSLHLYGATTQLPGDSADPSEYETMVAQSLYFEDRIRAFSELVTSLADEAGLQRPPAIALDEWNMRHHEPADWPDPLPGADGGVAPRELPAGGAARRVNRYSSRTLADALFYAGVFHVLYRSSGLPSAPTMANTVNLINANALIEVRPHGALASATYHVWDLYQNHLGPVCVPATVTGPSQRAGIRQGAEQQDGDFIHQLAEVPYLDAVATTSDDGSTLQVAVINRHPSESITARIQISDGDRPSDARLLTLGAGVDDLYASNSFSAPDRVALVDRGSIRIPDEGYAFAPHAISVLHFRLS